MQDEDAEALVVHVPTKGITALLRTHDTIRHVHGDEDEKLIGVYSTRENAEAATKRVAGKPGFADQPEGFEICPYELDVDHWTEGYITC